MSTPSAPFRQVLGHTQKLCRIAVCCAFLLSALAPFFAAAQPAATPCATPEAQQFDFWLGTWTLTWGEDGRGTNEIRRILDGCVIEENFEGQTPSGLFLGKSMSVYDSTAGAWKQTWVDNQGGYLDFTGRFEDDRMILQREATKDGQPVLQRMVWYNIAEDGMDWNWERSTDGGETWEVLWKIAYRRAP